MISPEGKERLITNLVKFSKTVLIGFVLTMMLTRPSLATSAQFYIDNDPDIQADMSNDGMLIPTTIQEFSSGLFGGAGSFDHNWDFTIGGSNPAGTQASVWNVSLGPLVDISGLTLVLLNGSGQTLAPSYGAGTYVGSLLQAGQTYTLQVSGDVSGLTGQGKYSGLLYLESVDTTVVPLPAAAWLFGSAIMGMTVVSRRKSKPTQKDS